MIRYPVPTDLPRGRHCENESDALHHCYVAGPGRIAAAALAFSIVTGAILLVACGGRNANLFASCEAGDVDRIKSLLDRGADVNARNRNGETPLMVAAGLLYPDAVRLLIARGADVNAETGGGETALSLALGTQRPEGSPEVEADLDKVVDLLVRHGATR